MIAMNKTSSGKTPAQVQIPQRRRPVGEGSNLVRVAPLQAPLKYLEADFY